jgi:hypothetical protein
MAGEVATWLRGQRETRGWARPEMARQLIQAAKSAGDTSVPSIDSMCHNLYRWERGTDSPSERYRLYYCRALGIPSGGFGNASHQELPEAIPAGQAPLSPTVIAYRGTEGSGMSRFHVEHEVLMAGHEGSDHAEVYEQHGIGEATSEQLRSDVTRLSRMCDTGSPLASFMEMRRVRARIYRLLDRRLWPREQADLFFLLGCVNGLMGVAAGQYLGYPDTAEELIRAGWAYASAIDNGPLLGLLRVKLSANMYWRGWYGESRDLAADGLRHVTHGPLAADLHLNYARASARLGEPEAARRAVEQAHNAQDFGYSDDLTDIGGEEFCLSQPTQHTIAAHAFADLSDGNREASAELEQAISLYDDPVPEQRSWFGGKALACTDLAVIRLRSGALDGAEAALTPVFILPVAQRVSTLNVRLTQVRDELAAPLFRGSPQARDLGDRIEDFAREAVSAGLHSLADGPG